MPRVALIVGGTSGIGHGIALTLARAGNDVTIAGRSVTAGQAIVDAMKEASPSNTYKFEKVDCFDLEDVKALAERTAKGPLDSLILTQGMATMQGHTPTKDGHDQKLQLHVHSRFLLAKLLAPKLGESEDGRCMSVLSAGIHGSYTNYEADPELEKSYSIKNAADAAGFYNDIFLEGLADAHASVAFAHAAPGFVSTSWGTEMPTPVRFMIRPLQRAFGKDKFKCGEDLMSNFLTFPKGKLSLVDQNGQVGKASLTKIHAEAKEKVWAHLTGTLDAFST